MTGGPPALQRRCHKTTAALKLLTVLEMTLVQFHAYQNKDHTLRIMSTLVKGRMKVGAGGQGCSASPLAAGFPGLSFPCFHGMLSTPGWRHLPSPWASLSCLELFKCFSDSCPNMHSQQGQISWVRPLACGSGWTPLWVLS